VRSFVPTVVLSSEAMGRAKSSQMPRTRALHVIRLARGDIARVLRCEEALFRFFPDRDFALMCDGASDASVVMGVGARDGGASLVNVALARQKGVRLIRRFTGGGTVVVDRDTLFVSFAMSSESVGVDASATYPRDVMRELGKTYGEVFARDREFALRENDYVFGDLKFGGNAQAIARGRFLHHTSFLYDYDDENMGLLKTPTRAPTYRNGRTHDAFVTTLKERGYTREHVFEGVCEAMRERGFETRELAFEDVEREAEEARARATHKWDTTEVL